MHRQECCKHFEDICKIFSFRCGLMVGSVGQIVFICSQKIGEVSKSLIAEVTGHSRFLMQT
jgi:hypothetical protein